MFLTQDSVFLPPELVRSVVEREVMGGESPSGVSNTLPTSQEHSGADQFWAGHPKLGELVGQSPAEKPTLEPGGSKLPSGRGWVDPPRAKKWGISFYSPEVGSVPARALWQMPLWQSDGRVVPVPSGLGCTEVAFWDGVEEGEHLRC